MELPGEGEARWLQEVRNALESWLASGVPTVKS